ncbi:long-chain fatty acid--CoA ligase [Nonomuraea africana]|uniref:Acyl-CoA synthetase (AMP-forming)/AMP-acid ligase II n=1 Tax=Nonomuraea africana TaxID=46171 RepID=A0ABR9KRM7_9ACTN|nr:long-chain fatty acid--CoA ligase [Nonomuraea africana]MBE1564192.1 acyl-CoA synthetase (AMP-forming)/AMP-acid ligase II [Nonomuraea africana]
MYLTQGLHRAVQLTPDLPATICGDRVRTWRESADRVARLAGALRELGVTKGDRVAMLSLNSDRYHEYLLAVWWVGGAVNPVNIRWNPVEIGYSLSESETTVLLVDDLFAAYVPALRDYCPDLATVIHCGDGATPDGMTPYEELITNADPVADLRLGGDSLAGLFYTGGTSGRPKGVMLSHANMLVSVMGSVAQGGPAVPGGRMLHSAPLFHIAGLAAWIGQYLVGGTHVMVPAFDPVSVMKAVQEHEVTSALMVPLMIQALVDHPQLGSYDLSSMTSIIYGASPISEDVLTRAMKEFPAAGFTQGYGMTELASTATLLRAEDHVAGGRLLRSAGRAATHCEVRIVDADGNEVPRGTVGEVIVRGGHVMLGYWNDPDETAAVVRDGWMHSGDGGYMDEGGYLYIVDRIKDMIVTGGENVYSTEVENAVSQHPAVAACAVIGVPDEQWGERVHAIIVLQPGATATAEEIRTHAKGLIAGYKAPRTCEFVEALPISGAGKILKRELRGKYWDDSDRQVG